MLKIYWHSASKGIDRQIQPKSDNIIAYQMYLELCRAYPIAHLDLIDFEMPSFHYIKNARNGHATNLYFPEENSDKFEWNEKDFIYQDYRENINGTNPPEGPTKFQKMFQEYKNQLEEWKIASKQYMDHLAGRGEDE